MGVDLTRNNHMWNVQVKIFCFKEESIRNLGLHNTSMQSQCLWYWSLFNFHSAREDLYHVSLFSISILASCATVVVWFLMAYLAFSFFLIVV